MVVLIVGFVNQEEGFVSVSLPTLQAIRKTESREFNSLWKVELAFCSEKPISRQLRRGPMRAPSWNV